MLILRPLYMYGVRKVVYVVVFDDKRWGEEGTGLHCFRNGGFHALKGSVALRVGVEHCFLFS